MKINDLPSWARDHFAHFLDFVRIYLGIGLAIKGVLFLTQGAPQLGSIGGPLAGLTPLVPWIHIVGGVMLALGILTRVASAAQMPVLCAALFLVHMPQFDTLRGREGVEFSALVLFLLALILIRGAGPVSLARTWRRGEPLAFKNCQRWLEDHSDVFADAVRIYLGIGLFVKGMYIMDHREELFALMNNGINMPFGLAAAAHYVIPAHFVGGALLALGLLSRWGALANIPPLVGAVFFLFLPGFTTLEMRQSLEFTALVLFLLSLVAVFGAGRVSLERTMGISPATVPIQARPPAAGVRVAYAVSARAEE